jgi:hypothetical protein
MKGNAPTQGEIIAKVKIHLIKFNKNLLQNQQANQTWFKSIKASF